MSSTFRQPILIPSRQVLFILATVVFALFVFAFVSFIASTVFSSFESIGMTMQTSMDTNSSLSSGVDTFMTNVVEYSAVLGLIALGIWAWQYSQKRGVEVYG